LIAEREHAPAVRVDDGDRAAVPAFDEGAAQRLDQNGIIHWSARNSAGG